MRNRAPHRLLVDGVTVEYRDAGGSIRGAQARVIAQEIVDDLEAALEQLRLIAGDLNGGASDTPSA